MEVSKSNNYLDSTCNKCDRKGFTWARGICQYCGHRQFEDDLFASEREERELLNNEAVEQYRSEHKRLRESKNLGDGADGGDDWGFFDGDGGDCGGDGD